MDRTTISTVIPTLGRPRMLDHTLTSVLTCDPAAHEVIVVDGDSEASAKRVVEEVAERTDVPVRFVAAQPGLTHQRNVGLSHCSGEIVAFFDDDVMLNPDVFSLLGAEYEDPSVVGVTGRVIEHKMHRFGRKESPLRRWLPGGGTEGSFTRFGYPRYITHIGRPCDVEFMQGCFMSARRSAALEVGFDERLGGYGLAEDEDFTVRLARLGRLRYLPDAILHHKQAATPTYGSRRLSRQVVVNRTYLFRKNFIRTPLARLEFALLVLILLAHRAINLNGAGVVGIIEGVAEAWRTRGSGGGHDAPSVLFVSSHARSGGSERYLETLLHGLERTWVRGVVSLEEGPLVEHLRGAGLPVTALETSGAALAISRSAWHLRKVLAALRPDVVHANGVKAALCARLATIGMDTSLVWLKHDFAYDRRLAHFIARGCTKVIGVSNAVMEAVTDGAGSAHVVHTGIAVPNIDGEESRRSLITEMSPPVPQSILGVTGRLHPAKGHIEILEIARDLIRSVEGLRIVLVGGRDPSFPKHADLLRQRVAELGLQDSVTFLGHREDACSIMAACDATAVPTIEWGRAMGREGFPLVALEALAVGTPVVAYDLGGMRELVGPCGLLVRPGDRAALTEALVDVLSDASLRSKLGDCGSRRVRERFVVDAMVDSLRSVYRAAAFGERGEIVHST